MFSLLISLFFSIAESATLGNPSGSFSGSLVPCSEPEECNWDTLVIMLQGILNFLIMLGVTISALMFAYAGFLYVTSAEAKGNLEKAKKIFGHVIIGLIIMLVAWLVIDTILRALTGKGFEAR